MRLCAAGLAGLALAVSLGCSPAPLVWSPDGRWLAYTMAVRSSDRVLQPGWLYGLEPRTESEQLGWADPADRPAPVGYRLWTTRPDTGASTLLEESRHPMTAPVWRADGKAVAFGRLSPDSDGRQQFEVVVQDSPTSKRVVSKPTLVPPGYRTEDLPGLTLAWSADGRYLAVPLLEPAPGIAIIRVDDGRVLKEVPDATLPSWSPDGTKLVFLRGADVQSLHCLDTNFGAPRRLAEIGRACQPPIWSRDKRSVLIVSRRSRPPGKDEEGRRAATHLVRVAVDGVTSETIVLPIDPNEGVPKELGTAFAFDQEAETLLFSDDAEGDHSIVVWFVPRTREVRKKDTPVDFTIRVSAFALATGGKTLAFRAGGPHYYPPPGLWDLSTNRMTPLTPDDSARLEWIATLVASARQVLRNRLPPVMDQDGRLIERPTMLPIPGELDEKDSTTGRLQRLGRLGASLCDPLFNGAEVDSALRDKVAEARLFFDYLRGDYNAALRSLEELEAEATSPEQRLRLVSLRAQIFAGQGEGEQVDRTVDFLRTLERKAPRRLEITPAGVALTANDLPGRGWPDYLALKVRDWAKTAGQRDGGAAGLDDPLTPRAPEPGMIEAIPVEPENALQLRQDVVPADIEPKPLQRLVPIRPQPRVRRSRPPF